ncbi:IS630 family transposase [Corallococcus sicarius]|uniref:IS630 family transposase n=1 Tax=Corallococcus sicarius TaxID=2316726 RepID=A0A3A8P6B2_9BACT|nr:IS630 family transposase [Corallococcus sicarius]RKH47922.1 IS630 family transposase [Corallococcus sicarius]
MPTNVRHRVTLTAEEKQELRALVAGGTARVRHVKRAQVLLAAHAQRTDEAIARSVQVGASTVFRVKRRFVEGGVEHALHDKQRAGAERKLSGKEEALLVATACSGPPAGRARWTLQLLADEMVRLTEHPGLSRETVRRRLEENELKPWQRRMWCIPKVDAEYVARMEDVLELYAAPADKARPLVCFDETPVQLIGEVRTPVPAAPGRPRRYDYEYQRNGTANLFVHLDVHAGLRHVDVTPSRTSKDFAHQMRALLDEHYPDAAQVRVVLDNLSTHSAAALYETFPPEEARRLLRRLEFHFVPKHASWLNMVEIEISILTRQCLGRRLGDVKALKREVARWQRQRNLSRARIRWRFSVDSARQKLGKSYPLTAQAAAHQAAA